MRGLRQLAVLSAVSCAVASAGVVFLSQAFAADKPSLQAIVQAVKANPASAAAVTSSASQPGKVSSVITIDAAAVASAVNAGMSMSHASSGKVRSATAMPGQDELYDPSNPDYSKLQKANESLAGFTLDKKEYVNWMSVLKANLISPRADLTGKGKMEILDQDIIMKATRSMPYVKFPHKSHTMWLACSNCHDQIFVKKIGANKIDMTKIFRGQYCGVCHDKVAFSMFFSCETCHSVPQNGAKAWWN